MTTATIARPKVSDQKMLIDGKFVDSVSGKTFETINPATGDTICRIAEADQADVDLAVKAARRALVVAPMDASKAVIVVPMFSPRTRAAAVG